MTVVVLQCPAGQADVYFLANYTASLVHAALNLQKDRLVAFDVHHRCAAEGKCHLRVIVIAQEKTRTSSSAFNQEKNRS